MCLAEKSRSHRTRVAAGQLKAMDEIKLKDGRLDRAITETKEYHDLNYDADDDDPYTDDDAIDDLLEKCGMDRYGNCSLAGTEECDWDCPFS